MNSNCTFALSPVRSTPWGWSIPTIRTVWRMAFKRFDQYDRTSSGCSKGDKGILLHSATWPKVESATSSVTPPQGYVPGSSSATSCCDYATGRN